jgi:hypothetical protein
MFSWRRLAILLLAGCLISLTVQGQIDPVKRELIQFGYNAPLEGHPPLSAYAFYYRNQPDFLRTNFTLRLALAPTYLDSELGISGICDDNTALGLGVAGGGYGDSYYEIRQGRYLPEESFDGYSGQASLALYHLFNPGQQIPLHGVLRGSARFASYQSGSETLTNFLVPDPQVIYSVRTGLRWGGREPTLFPALAMELSIWYEGQYRTEAEPYGILGNRRIAPHSHLFWGEAFLAYQLPEWKHSFYVNLTAGTSLEADRFSAYRLGGFLPMVAEFPLSLPGYYYQELSAKQFVLLGGNYTVPLERRQRWNVNATAATALVDYLPGLEQPGHWNSGVGAGIFYTSASWRVMLGYGYGIDAIRSSGRGAQTIGFLLQMDLAPAKEAFFKPEQPGRWRGIQRVFGVLGS